MKIYRGSSQKDFQNDLHKKVALLLLAGSLRSFWLAGLLQRMQLSSKS